jgi:hypothetical protein
MILVVDRYLLPRQFLPEGLVGYITATKEHGPSGTTRLPPGSRAFRCVLDSLVILSNCLEHPLASDDFVHQFVYTIVYTAVYSTKQPTT